MLELARRCAAAGDWTRLDADVDNARSVLGWCAERAELAVGARLFWSLRDYFYLRGLGKELEGWRERLLALPEAARPSVSRARLLACPPFTLFSSAEQERAAAQLAEATALSRALGDAPCLTQALERLVVLRIDQGEYEAVVAPAEEVLTHFLAAGNARGAGAMYGFLISAALARGR